MKSRKLISDSYASAVPLIVFCFVIVGAGALYTLLILEVGQPVFDAYIPAGDVKTFVMMVIYSIPIFVLVVGVIWLIMSGLKREVSS